MQDKIKKIKAVLLLDPNRSLKEKRRMAKIIDVITSDTATKDDISEALASFGVPENRVADSTAIILTARKKGFTKDLLIDLLEALGLPEKQIGYMLAIDQMISGEVSAPAAITDESSSDSDAKGKVTPREVILE